jgi:serine/threonine-protein kinase
VAPEPLATDSRVLGRYALHQEIAAGGMATVYFGRLLGPIGFNRTVAIKRLHPQFAKEPDFVDMFLDEARLAARVKHPNVVSILDVVAREGELFLVMEYVHGESLSRLLRLAEAAEKPVPLPILSAIVIGLLCGLHAAHEARDELGNELHIVHRDVSPQNVLVGADGVSRLLDFGIAKAAGRLQTTREGQFKGKLAYMAPEQIVRGAIDRRCDVYAAGVLLWSALAGALPFVGGEASVMFQILSAEIAPPSSVRGAIPAELDALVLRAMARAPEGRFATALEMAAELERVVPPATQLAVGAWVAETARSVLDARSEQLREAEGTPSRSVPPRNPSERPPQHWAVQTDLTAMPGAVDLAPDPPTLPLVTAPKLPSAGKGRWIAFGVGGMALGVIALAAQLLGTGDRAEASLPSASPTPPSDPTPPANAPAIDVTPALVSAQPEAEGSAAPSASATPHAAPRSGQPRRPPPAKTATAKPDYGF